MIEPEIRVSRYGRRSEVFALPVDETFLHTLLTDLFEHHWSEIVFGPLVEGAAFEFRCAGPPRRIVLYDGYLTVDLGESHFHLCIGENVGGAQRPTPPAQRRHRRTASAELFRLLDPDGNPVTWGLSLANGEAEQLCTIFFPNPLLTDDGRPATSPDWSRLELWDALLARYLDRPSDPRDRTARRFYHG